MTDILDEVLNDENEAKKLYYFKKFLPIAIISTIITILLMLIYNWQEDKKVRNNQQTGDILVKSIALINDDKDLTIKSLENLVESSNNRIGELASIEQFSIEIKQNNISKATELLKAMIANKNYSELTTSYARLVWLTLTIDKSDLSNINVKEIEEFLNYFDNENKPFYGTANLIRGMWYIKTGSKDLASKILNNLITLENISSIVKEQAKALLSNI
ncbi:MAG: DUF2659 family protein [Rickettsia endosymbiont of Bryobia graminum]|nr:DUF2659 family protein [Rickettsia endosymbiont of Bryobia graminum]